MLMENLLKDMTIGRIIYIKYTTPQNIVHQSQSIIQTRSPIKIVRYSSYTYVT
jgi:hypothetical protein